MMSRGNREITINRNDLIDKILNNKKAHIIEYEKAVIAYKLETLKQLEVLKTKIESGDLNIGLNLTKPVDNSENYDSILEMFEWEVNDIITLSQSEFREYVQDDSDFSRQGKFSNQFYVG
jgi:hypothetical protein